MVLFANESKLEECQNVNESSELNVLEGGVDNNEDNVDILGIADDIITTGICW